MDSRKQIEEALRPLLKGAGYRKSKLSWHKSSETAVTVLNVQKSAWGDSYYINCAVSLLGLNPNPKPPEYECHIRARISALLRDESGWDLGAILEFDNNILSSEERRDQLASLVSGVALPWLESLSTEDQVRERLDSLPKGLMVLAAVRRYLK